MAGLHVCFVAPSIYPVLARGGDLKFAGGAEVQQAVVAKALAREGMRVSVVCYSPKGRAIEHVEGVEVHTLPHPSGGIKGLRFIHPRLTAVGGIVRKLAPDVVYNRAAGAYLGGLAVALLGTRSRLIYAAASDNDFVRGPAGNVLGRDAPLFRLGIRCAHAVLVQNAVQRQSLRDCFGREGEVVANTYEEPESRPGAHDGPVLWIGSVKPLKSPEKFIELARRLPAKRFVMVGGPGNAADARPYFQAIQRAASLLPNLEFEGFVPFEHVGQCFDGASVLVNTSQNEGFPNTFLQAWIRGIPSLSFVRPEVEPGRTGTIACTDIDDMAVRLKALVSDEPAWRLAQVACRERFNHDHTMAGALRAYRRVFELVRQ